MSATYDEVTMMSRLAGEISGLVSQLQAMTSSTRADVKEFKAKQKSLNEKTKMFGMVVGGVVSRIAEKTNRD